MTSIVTLSMAIVTKRNTRGEDLSSPLGVNLASFYVSDVRTLRGFSLDFCHCTVRYIVD